jgi:hypothetical protein
MEIGNTFDTLARNATDWFVWLIEASEDLSFTPEEMYSCAVALLQGEACQWWTSVTVTSRMRN